MEFTQITKRLLIAVFSSLLLVSVLHFLPNNEEANQEVYQSETKPEVIFSADGIVLAEERPATIMSLASDILGTINISLDHMAEEASEKNQTMSEENQTTVTQPKTEKETKLKKENKSETKKKQTKKSKKEKKSKSAFENKFVVNVTEYLNVRAKGKKNAEVVGKLYPGSGGEVVKRGKKWTKIKSGNVEGYVKNDFVVFDKEAEEHAKNVCELKATVTVDNLRIRKEASTQSSIWDLASAGETYSAISADGQWVSINYNGVVAYLSAEYVKCERQIGKAITIAEEQELIRLENERREAERLENERIAAETEANRIRSIEQSRFVETVQSSAYSVTQDDAYLLACLVHSEAGGEPYEGKLAVANIVLNRVRGGQYGNTLTDVIYAPGQFTVAASGILSRVIAGGPNAESVQAAKDALAGKNNVPDYTSFCTLGAASYGYYRAYSVIGNQVFYCR